MTKIVYKGGCGEVIAKKSRFIATVYGIESEEQAKEYIEDAKKKYWDASHNCYAYIIGGTQEVSRFSDDKEPGGTAGKPILEVLQKNDMVDVLVIVTRYFGGTLLGTGGLIRAYTQVTKEGLIHACVVERKDGWMLELQLEYTDLGRVQYELGERKIPIYSSQYVDQVSLKLLVDEEEVKSLKKSIPDITGGRTSITEVQKCAFGDFDGERKML